MAKDYYETLGVDRTATRDEIKKAYKHLAKEYHPDLSKRPDAEQRFKEINEAAAVLGDEEKRRQYDAMGHDAFASAQKGGAGPGFQGYDFSGFGPDMDFDQIFESFFGGGFSDIFTGRRTRRRGTDLRYDLTLTLTEAALGTQRRITLRKRSECTACHGKGGKRLDTCPTCHGTGYVRRQQRTPFGIFQTTGSCPDCGGEGSVIGEECPRCHGSGIVMERKELELQVPAGVDDGSRLRVAGEGEAAGKGARPGDLYVFITVEPHALFQRQGNDILLEAPLSFFQAVFGDDIEVPTLEGRARLKIPPGTQSGTLFRLREKGIQLLHGRGKGDQLVRVQVVTPKRLTRKQEALLRDLGEEFGEAASPQQGLFNRLKEHLR
jgi:molecular chaperone DnaJ